MPILTPTKIAGAQATPNELLYVDPACAVTGAELAAQLADRAEGLDPTALADLLSAALTHERCGVHLYRAVAARSTMPELSERYEELGAETLAHVEVLEALVTAAGGNPSYVSAQARATEGLDAKLVESTYLASGTLDPLTAELAMLDAVILAETIDNANWALLEQLAGAMLEGELRSALEAAVSAVRAQETEHLGWATSTKQQLLLGSILGG